MRTAALPDDRAAVAAALRDLACELLVIIGGASVGEHDVVKPALAELGLDLVVDGVAVRPGKPTWFGQIGDGRRVLGLPGNPVSAMVCAELFAVPILATMAGRGVRHAVAARAPRRRAPRHRPARTIFARGAGGAMRRANSWPTPPRTRIRRWCRSSPPPPPSSAAPPTPPAPQPEPASTPSSSTGRTAELDGYGGAGGFEPTMGF